MNLGVNLLWLFHCRYNSFGYFGKKPSRDYFCWFSLRQTVILHSIVWLSGQSPDMIWSEVQWTSPHVAPVTSCDQVTGFISHQQGSKTLEFIQWEGSLCVGVIPWIKLTKANSGLPCAVGLGSKSTKCWSWTTHCRHDRVKSKMLPCVKQHECFLFVLSCVFNDSVAPQARRGVCETHQSTFGEHQIRLIIPAHHNVCVTLLATSKLGFFVCRFFVSV